jgi:hypothetical protein
MDLYFGDYKVPKVITYEAQRNARNTKTEYNANGDMLIDMVNRKFTLTVYLGQLTQEEMAQLYEKTEPVFFPVSFFSPFHGAIQREFFLSCQPAHLDFTYGGQVYYKATKLVLEEK